MEAKYQNEKKELEIQNLNKDKKLKQVELDRQLEETKRQNAQKIGFAIGFGLMLILAIVVFRNYRQKKKDNLVISKQKQEVEFQKDLVEEKNKEIIDSINYAKRLQEAILPPKRIVQSYLSNSFILYKPKDIVAGDFYWMETVGDSVYFAAADCTGHGVPGAMVSVVCSNALSKALIEENITDPGKILDRTRELVIERFGQSEEDIKDGMDIALVSLAQDERGSESEKYVVHFAGANNPLWIIRNGADEVEEIKADKQPIGKYAAEKPFTTHEVKLNPGDSIYIFSDGYQDQFGGDKGKKYKTGRMKKFLLSIRDQDMQTQRELLNEEFENWKGGLEQLDDVCLIGVRI